jgi:hypothetical protein
VPMAVGAISSVDEVHVLRVHPAFHKRKISALLLREGLEPPLATC